MALIPEETLGERYGLKKKKKVNTVAAAVQGTRAGAGSLASQRGASIGATAGAKLESMATPTTPTFWEQVVGTLKNMPGVIKSIPGRIGAQTGLTPEELERSSQETGLSTNPLLALGQSAVNRGREGLQAVTGLTPEELERSSKETGLSTNPLLALAQSVYRMGTATAPTVTQPGTAGVNTVKQKLAQERAPGPIQDYEAKIRRNAITAGISRSDLSAEERTEANWNKRIREAKTLEGKERMRVKKDQYYEKKHKAERDAVAAGGEKERIAQIKADAAIEQKKIETRQKAVSDVIKASSDPLLGPNSEAYKKGIDTLKEQGILGDETQAQQFQRDLDIFNQHKDDPKALQAMQSRYPWFTIS